MLVTLLLLVGFQSNAQIKDPTKWSYKTQKVSENIYDLVFTVKIEKGFHMYSQFQDTTVMGPFPASFTFNKSPGIEFIGGVKEITKAKKVYDDGFEGNVFLFENLAIFKQRIKSTDNKKKVEGLLEYQACSTECIRGKKKFSFSLADATDAGSSAVTPDKITTASTPETVPAIDTAKTDKHAEKTAPADGTVSKDNDTPKNEAQISSAGPGGVTANESLWSIFFQGLLGGFIALITPCLYPMIPLTVSFFTKKNEKRSGLSKALLFGLSIIVIYVGLAFIITRLFGDDALHSMSTNKYVNLTFFAIFTIFAISFFGAFELTLPSSWANKADAQSEKGGLIGIFFVAFTLTIVSFSCTGPIVGNLLVLAAKGSNTLGVIVGMLGFSIALALPFTVFAAFPALMQSLPKSGGWLNAVKIVFGFLELALALKFFSNADLPYHWGLLKREYFLALWIIIFALMGFYLLGKLKFSHDTPVNYVSVPRLLLAIFSFAFAAYMVPGLWGAPLDLLSGIIPPDTYSEWHQSGGTASMQQDTKTAGTGTSATEGNSHKYAKLFECPYNLNCYYDYDEALQAARQQHKPLMIDFTGWACSNCRKMEKTVWVNPEVLNRLKNDFIIVSLYVDDKTPIDKNELAAVQKENADISTIGDRWTNMQVTRYNRNSQPWYVLVDNNGQTLTKEPGRGYDPDVEAFVRFLDEGKSVYSTRQNTSMR